eukprot:c26474_g1_i1 orf=560-841(-)
MESRSVAFHPPPSRFLHFNINQQKQFCKVQYITAMPTCCISGIVLHLQLHVSFHNHISHLKSSMKQSTILCTSLNSPSCIPISVHLVICLSWS